ncbi:MAG: hypothetical protein WED11_11790 [Natronospirillum sp.]
MKNKHLAPRRWTRQQGVALLLLMMILFATGTSLFLAGMNNRSPYLDQREEVQRQLALAKEALLAYAVNYADISNTGKGPGRLPCMDENHDGMPDASCTHFLGYEMFIFHRDYYYSRVGQLPASLFLPGSGSPYLINRHYEGINQQFWYGVSWKYRESGTRPINSTMPGGHYSITGHVDEMVAVLVAPGDALASQNRNSTNIANYLELDTSRNIDNRYGWRFGSGNNAEDFNDIVVGISRRELMLGVTARVTAEVKQQLDAYHNIEGRYPANNTEYETSLAGIASWFNDDNWDGVNNYNQVSPDEATLSFDGCAIVYTLNVVTGTTRAPNRC